MSTSLLDHAFGIRGSESTRTDYQAGQVIFTIHQDHRTCRRSACGAREVQLAAGRVKQAFHRVGFRVGHIGRFLSSGQWMPNRPLMASEMR